MPTQTVKKMPETPEEMSEYCDRNARRLVKQLVILGMWVPAGEFEKRGWVGPRKCVYFWHRICGRISVTCISGGRGYKQEAHCFFCDHKS